MGAVATGERRADSALEWRAPRALVLAKVLQMKRIPFAAVDP